MTPSIRAVIFEMHVTQCSDRIDESWAAAYRLPWWACARRWLAVRRAFAAERELAMWRARLEQETAA